MSFTNHQSFHEYAMSLPDYNSDGSDSSDEPYRPYAQSDSDSEPEFVNSNHSDSDRQSNPDSDTHSEDFSDFSGNNPGSYNSDRDSSPAGSSAPSETSENSDYRDYLGPDGKLLESERERRWIFGLCYYCGGEHLQAHCYRLWARDHPDSASEASENTSEYSGEFPIDSDNSENSDSNSDYWRNIFV